MKVSVESKMAGQGRRLRVQADGAKRSDRDGHRRQSLVPDHGDEQTQQKYHRSSEEHRVRSDGHHAVRHSRH